MNLKEEILAKMQQNKLDRAKHQELVESLDRGLIYLQGQLDLVVEMAKRIEESVAAEAKKVADAAKAELAALAGKTNVAAAETPDSPAPAAPALSVVPDAPAADASAPAAPVELSPLPDAPQSN